MSQKRQAYSAGRAKRAKTAGARYQSRQQRPVPNVVTKTPKGMDTSITNAGIVSTTNTNDDILVLNLVQQASGSWNRVGRKIKLKSIRLKGHAVITLGISTNELGNSLRMCLVWDKQPSGNAIPAFDEIFGITEQDGTESSTTDAPPRYDNMERFRVLMDKTIACNPQASNPVGGGDQTYYLPFDEYVPTKGCMTNFSGQSQPMTISDISSGALYFVVRAQQTAAGTVALSDSSIARLRYLDME